MEICQPVLQERIFLKGFYHIWALQSSWSCDLNYLYKLSFPIPNEALHEV